VSKDTQNQQAAQQLSDKIKFLHLGVRESTHARIMASKADYEAKIGHKVSIAEYMDALSKAYLPFQKPK
jgi:hypothetical protein